MSLRPGRSSDVCSYLRQGGSRWEELLVGRGWIGWDNTARPTGAGPPGHMERIGRGTLRTAIGILDWGIGPRLVVSRQWWICSRSTRTAIGYRAHASPHATAVEHNPGSLGACRVGVPPGLGDHPLSGGTDMRARGSDCPGRNVRPWVVEARVEFRATCSPPGHG